MGSPKRFRWIAGIYRFHNKAGNGQVFKQSDGWKWIGFRYSSGILINEGSGGPFKTVIEAKKACENFIRKESQ